jgi:hypothetical protein
VTVEPTITRERHAVFAMPYEKSCMRRFEYEFISERARDASARYGVKSVSLLARKER